MLNVLVIVKRDKDCVISQQSAEQKKYVIFVHYYKTHILKLSTALDKTIDSLPTSGDATYKTVLTLYRSRVLTSAILLPLCPNESPSTLHITIYPLNQGWANYGPRAACSPPEHFVRPAYTC